MYDGEECEHCGELLGPNEKLRGKCMFCHQELFCSQKCVFDGLHAHFKDCEEREKIQLQMQQREHMTPRSVLSKVFVLIEQDPELKFQLFSVFKSCEQDMQEKGFLVIYTHDASELCTMLNNSVNPSKTLVKLMDFRTCSRALLDKNMEPAIQLRLCLEMNNDYIVAVQSGDDACICRLFHVKSRRDSMHAIQNKSKE